MLRFYRVYVLLLLLLVIPAAAQDDADGYIRSNRLGITHISTSTEPTSERRYQQALALGAGWNRWPLYWDRIQTGTDTWEWEAFDTQVIQDIEYRFRINAILLGRPAFYASGNSIAGLNEPIYANGSDIPGNNKQINPENPWAQFVQNAVRRYKPGGLLAQNAAIPEDRGIRVWEVWNEPDLSQFWQGNFADYARLLKVAYIVIKSEDPEAQVMFGGLLYPTDVNWLAQVLSIFQSDPQREQNNWYMDIVAVHNYGDPWRSGWLTLYARETLQAYGLQRPIWLNETGVPVWDDYPGPIWEPESAKRASAEQQAWFLIQSAVYAWSEGADKVFYHQLYDDCGDQPPGTNFPPHDGALCRLDNANCLGDAFGIFRNPAEALCFSQHPSPGTARPIARAYRLLAEVFGSQPFSNGKRIFAEEGFVTFTFERALGDERITVMWNRGLQTAELEWEAVGTDGQLISLNESTVIQPNDDGVFTIRLPAALNDVDQTVNPVGGVAIGGAPYILIERVDDSVTPMTVNLDILETPNVAAAPSPVTAAESASASTVDPANDTTPPLAYVIDLPEISPPTFTVSWRGADDSGVEKYLVWVRVDGATWLPWLETSELSAEYTGQPGKSYEFSVWAVDLAGNWTQGTDINTQAQTRVE